MSCTHIHALFTSHVAAPAVRHKAKDIISFLQDDERLREARKSAKTTRDKYVGYSSEEAHGRYSECMSICSGSMVKTLHVCSHWCFNKASVFNFMGTSPASFVFYAPSQLSGYETIKLCAPLLINGPFQLSGYETIKLCAPLPINGPFQLSGYETIKLCAPLPINGPFQLSGYETIRVPPG